jgi:hypothetical protein
VADSAPPPPRARPRWPARPVFWASAATIFLSAFLVFLVQPIIAKLILPRFGGGVAVWATCLVFFQAALLLGYAYAHQLHRRDRSGRLGYLHIALLVASLAILPIIPNHDTAAAGAGAPALQIVALLLVTIGLPFSLLATTSPLLQAWVARAREGRDPYRLFVVSNLASLAALLAYPWLIEPWLGTAAQARAWSALYAAYVMLAAGVAWRSARRARSTAAPSSAAAAHDDTATAAGSVPWHRRLTWIALAALASYELVAVTNHLTQNVPSVPMMWTVPLVVYLLTFSLCFDGERWYRPRALQGATLVAVLAMCWALWEAHVAADIAVQTVVFVSGLFVACMVCHGELARSRPPPARLTGFYLCVSLGGVLGGAVVGLAAPALLPGYFEIEIGLVLVALIVLWRSWRAGPAWAAASAAVVVCATATAAHRIDRADDGVIAQSRNFYGVVRVREHGDADDPPTWERRLMHGSILHGQQYLDDALRRRPTSYYVESSGIGRLLGTLADRPLAVGVVGLGAGTIAAYGKPGDSYRFFEIDPAVIGVAQRYFSFIADSDAQVDVVLGDGRLTLQRDPDARRFDVLAVDAFSGDSIPVHLLTREAVALYVERLTPQGVIALHVSNRYLDLRPVVTRIAADLKLQVAYVEDIENDDDGQRKASSDWLLLARSRDILDRPGIADGARTLPAARPARAWTDDYSNIAQVLSVRSVLVD